MNRTLLGFKTVSMYRTAALLLLNTLVIFALLNLAAGLAFYLKDRLGPPPVGPLVHAKAHLQQVYPHMKEEEWRALLTETWTRPLAFETFTHFKERPSRGKYVNVAENGFRMNKRQGPWPPNPHAFNIFFFGGSTTFGYGVRDAETIPSVLEDLLSQEACVTAFYVYNFGRAYYYSSQEQVLFARLLVGGFVPQLAIFLDGVNESRWGTDEPSLTDDFRLRLDPHFRTTMPTAGVSLDIRLEMPVLRAVRAARARLDRIIVRNREGSHVAQQLERNAQKATIDLARYLRNKALIATMAAHFGSETLFVWQPSPAYRYDLRYHLFPPQNATIEIGRYVYREFDRIRTMLPEREQKRMLWLGDVQSNRKEPLYLDAWHYTAAFSREIAERIAQTLLSRDLGCRGAASLTEMR